MAVDSASVFPRAYAPLPAPLPTCDAPPAGNCQKCKGTGDFIGWSGRRVGPCFTCKGTGNYQPRETVGGVDCTKIVTLLNKAKESGLKWPKFTVGGVTFSLAPANGKNPGAVYVKNGDDYLGKILANVYSPTHRSTPELTAQVVLVAADPLAAAVNHGKLTGNCSCCRRPLSDPKSVTLGIGPVCKKRFGL